MEHLRRIESPQHWSKFWLWGRKYYYLDRHYTHYSERHDKHITADPGIYDGATGAFDDVPEAWLPHDAACLKGVWDDGTPIKRIEAADLVSDILSKYGYKVRSQAWKWSTYWLGCDKVKNN